MKVTLAQHGGQAAGIRLNTPPLTIDSAALDKSEAAELGALAAAATSASPSAARSAKTRDEMSYTITVQHEGRETVLSQSDTTMSADFGKLLAWLQRQSRK
jgi:hypothetical protein